MNVSSDCYDSTGTIDGDGVSRSSKFLKFCVKVRNNDPSILPELGKPFQIRDLSEKEHMELADALMVNNNVTSLELHTNNYTKSSAEAMAKYVRTSKRLQRIHLGGELGAEYRHREDILCCFLSAFQESTSLKELCINFRLLGGPSNRALKSMMTHTQSLRSLSLVCPVGQLDDIHLAAARSGLKNNTTLQKLTLEFPSDTTTDASAILSSLRDHPLLRTLCLRGKVVDLNGLETVLLNDTSKITELDIRKTYYGGPPMRGLTPVLQALARRPTLTKLGIHGCPLGRDKARLLGMVLCNAPNLQSLVLRGRTLENAELAEIAPALYRNTSIKELDMSHNSFSSMDAAVLLRGILHSNKTITALDLSINNFGGITGAVDCIADGLGSNSTLLKIDLSNCALRDGGVSTMAENLSSRNTTLQKLTLKNNAITSTGVAVLLDMMEHSCHITDLDLGHNRIGNEGASLLTRSLGNNALPNLTRLSLSQCSIDDDGFVSLTSALEQNTSLLHLDLRYSFFTERSFLALAESLPEIKVLQRVDFNFCKGLASAIPLLLSGLRKNTSLFRIHVANCVPCCVPPTTEETARFAGGWMQEMERLGYRNRFRPLICAPIERLPPLGVWPRALSQVAILPAVIFEVLRSKPSLVLSEDTEGKEVAEDTGVPEKRKCGDE
jgi:Ran GTPase-activating protein (RanGAP) involved in mRNA processing and transport